MDSDRWDQKRTAYVDIFKTHAGEEASWFEDQMDEDSFLVDQVVRQVAQDEHTHLLVGVLILMILVQYKTVTMSSTKIQFTCSCYDLMSPRLFILATLKSLPFVFVGLSNDNVHHSWTFTVF